MMRRVSLCHLSTSYVQEHRSRTHFEQLKVRFESVDGQFCIESWGIVSLILAGTDGSDS